MSVCGCVHMSVHEEQRGCSLDLEWQEGVGQNMAGIGAEPDPLKNRKHSYLLSISPAHNNYSALRAGSQLNFIQNNNIYNVLKEHSSLPYS